IIDKQLFAGVVLLPKREVLSSVPLAVQVAEPAVAVACCIGLLIFLPEQLQRQILVALQFLMDRGEIRWRVYATARWSRPPAEQEFVEFLVAEVFRQRPAELGGLGQFQIFVNGALDDRATT